jgi:hypothetical protein
MLSLTPWNQIVPSYSTHRIWYVCHVEKNVPYVFEH